MGLRAPPHQSARAVYRMYVLPPIRMLFGPQPNGKLQSVNPQNEMKLDGRKEMARFDEVSLVSEPADVRKPTAEQAMYVCARRRNAVGGAPVGGPPSRPTTAEILGDLDAGANDEAALIHT